MEMGAYLIFLATSGAEAYRQPIEGKCIDSSSRFVQILRPMSVLVTDFLFIRSSGSVWLYYLFY